MSAYQPVLDPACGGRMFWFDKSDSRVLFGDVRDEVGNCVTDADSKSSRTF